jgi:peptide/nickel transport system substrate-binding protein
MGWNHSSGGRRWLLLSLLVAMLAVGLAWGLAGAFGASSSPAPGNSGPVIFRVGYLEGPDNLNPFQGSLEPSYEYWHLNWLMLYGQDPVTGNAKPELAADLPQYSADGLTVTIKLKQGVQWSDGQPFTSKDVVWTYGTIIRPDLVKKGATGAFLAFLQNLKGNGLQSVTAPDDYTVVLHYNEYRPNVDKLWIPILPEHIWKNIDISNVKLKITTAIAVGTGPYIYDSDKPGVFLKLVKNPNWSSVIGPAPKVDQVIFQTYQESGSMVSDFETGQLAVIYGVPTAEFDRIKGESSKGLQTIECPSTIWDYMAFNVFDSRQVYGTATNTSLGNPVLLDPEFRHAVAYAIDHETLVKSAYGGHADPGDSIFPPGVWPKGFDYHYTPGLNGTVKYTFDLNKAKSILDAAGYKDVNGDGWRETKDGKPLSLRMFTRTESIPSQKCGQLICTWLGQIGIKTTLRVISYNALNAAAYEYDSASNFTPNFDLYCWGWTGYQDPGDTLVCFTKDQIQWWNDPGWFNPAFEQAFVAQESEMDPIARVPLVHEAARILYEDAPEIVMAYPHDLSAYNSKQWSGWVHYLSNSFGDQGAVVMDSNATIDTYVSVHPTGATKSGGSSIWILWVAIAVVVLGGGVVWLVMRRGGKEVDEGF